MPASKILWKLEAFAAAGSFLMIFVTGLMGRLAVAAGVPDRTAETVTKLGILFFFLVFGFSCIGLMIHMFVVLQVKAGNAAAPMVRFMAEHETGVTIAFWCFLGFGLLIALPFALHDMLGGQMPLASSRGVFVADIGMTIDEIKSRSSLKVPEPRHMGDGSYFGEEELVFDFQIANSTVRFPQSRYYWITTKPNDRRVVDMNIGISPRKMPMPQLQEFQQKLQSQLFADGWMPGHYLAKSEETVHLWGGEKTAGDGRYWMKGETLLTFQQNRMDEAKRDEPKGSGEYILYIHMHPKSEEKDLVFEPSAWKH